MDSSWIACLPAFSHSSLLAPFRYIFKNKNSQNGDLTNNRNPFSRGKLIPEAGPNMLVGHCPILMAGLLKELDPPRVLSGRMCLPQQETLKSREFLTASSSGDFFYPNISELLFIGNKIINRIGQ
jgi:hypothetical protein